MNGNEIGYLTTARQQPELWSLCKLYMCIKVNFILFTTHNVMMQTFEIMERKKKRKRKKNARATLKAKKKEGAVIHRAAGVKSCMKVTCDYKTNTPQIIYCLANTGRPYTDDTP